MSFTITNLGSVTNSTGATLAITVPAAGIPKGALVLVLDSEANNITYSTGGTMTDTQGNTYTQVVHGNNNNIATVNFGVLWQSILTTALVSGNTITLTKQVSGGNAIMAGMSITGQLASSPLDATTQATAFGSSSTPSVTSGVPTVNNELIIGGMSWQDTANATYSQDTTHSFTVPFATGKTTGGVQKAAIGGGSKVISGASAQTFSPTLTASDRWWAFVVGVKPAPTAASLGYIMG